MQQPFYTIKSTINKDIHKLHKLTIVQWEMVYIAASVWTIIDSNTSMTDI